MYEWGAGMIGRLRIFHHHIYELRKGLRNLILFTTSREHRDPIEKKLATYGIPYLIVPVAPGSERINVFFGNSLCIDVLRHFDCRSLADFTAEQDFILGVMLGYDRLKQCARYLRIKDRRGEISSPDVSDELEDTDLDDTA